MLRASCFSHFLDKCVTPDMTSKKKKKAPSLAEFWNFSDGKPGDFFKLPTYGSIEVYRVSRSIPVPNHAE